MVFAEEFNSSKDEIKPNFKAGRYGDVAIDILLFIICFGVILPIVSAISIVTAAVSLITRPIATLCDSAFSDSTSPSLEANF